MDSGRTIRPEDMSITSPGPIPIIGGTANIEMPPLDPDLGEIFKKSQGKLFMPCIMAQVLRDLARIKEGLAGVGQQVSALAIRTTS